MAEVAGKNLYFSLGGTDLSAYIKSVDFHRSVGTFDTSAGGDSSETSIPTLKNCTIRLAGAWDDSIAAASLNDELESYYGVSAAWEYGPTTNTATERKFSGNGFIIDLDIPADVGGGVEWTATIQVSGDVAAGAFT